MVVLEALAAGRPIAASAVGGLADVVTTEVGWLCEPTSEGWSRMLQHALPLAGGPGDQCEGGVARAEYERTYSPERTMRTLLDVYARVSASA